MANRNARVEISLDVEALRDILGERQEKMPQVVREVLTRQGIEGESLTKRKTPVDTGRLRSSVSHQVEDDYVAVGSNVKYAPFVIGDVPPFIIKPRRAKALRFKIGNRVIFAQRVRHPGGKKILQKVAEELRRKQPQVVHEVLVRQGIIE